MKKIFFLIAMLLLCASAVEANWYSHGSYWYYPGYSQAYTRTSYYVPGYYSYGIYYPGTYSYSYAPYYAPAATAATGNWRVEQMKAIAAQAKYKAQEVIAAQENKAYLDSLNVLGAQGSLSGGNGGYVYGNGTVPSYVLPGYSTHGHYYSNQLYGASAGTQYGYPLNSFNAQAAMYQDNYQASLYQMANQQTVNLQALTDKAQSNFLASINAEGVNRANVANINARRDFAIAMLKALELPPSSSSQGFKFTIEPQGVIANKAASSTKASVYSDWVAHVQQSCIQCHSGANPKGGFDVSSYLTATPERKQQIWEERLVTKDESKRMPPPDKGPRLTAEQLRLWAIVEPVQQSGISQSVPTQQIMPPAK